MSNHLVKACKDGSGSSGTSSHSHQSCWMSRWTQAPSKQGSLVAPHSQAFAREEGLDHKQKRLRSSLNISSDIPSCYGGGRNNTKAETVGLTVGNLTIRAENVRKERSDFVPFCFLGHSRNGENTWTRTPMDPCCSYMANSLSAMNSNPSSPLLFATQERANPNFQSLSNCKSCGKDLAVSKSSEDDVAGLTCALPHVPDDADNPGTVFKRRFSDNDYASLDQGISNCGKYSAIVVHERSSFRPERSLLSSNHAEDMQNDIKLCFVSRADVPRPCHGRRTLEGLPCPVRNVKAMKKICATVDSLGNSHGCRPLFSQSTTRHVLFTNQTGVVRGSTKNGGVKIQPLWSSTDSEKDNLGDSETPRGQRSFDLSDETDTMDAVALPNKNDFSGMLSPPIAKSTTRDKSLPMASVAPWEDKVRGKLPVTETPDTNSMDGVEPSPSRTQSLEAEHLLSCAEQPSGAKSMPIIDEFALQEPSSRRVKRLKLSSTKRVDSSSNEKKHTFFNVFMKCSSASPDAPSTDKHKSKESSIPTQNMVPLMNGESTLRDKNPIFQCSWIQRWCQVRPVAPNRHPSETVVICEPQSSKLPFDELGKKRIPSLAAVALMGKSMDWFPPCKITKRGSLVVWNTDC